MFKAFRFNIKRPSKAVAARLEQTLFICRELYDAGFQERQDVWNLNRISISSKDQAVQLPGIKTFRNDLTTVYAQVLQETLRRLDKTFKTFFA